MLLPIRPAPDRSRANAVKTFSAIWPLPRMLSHDITVNGSMPLERRRTSASVTRPNVVAGTARERGRPGRPVGFVELTSRRMEVVAPSVTVSETIRVAGSAIFSMTASGSSGAYRYCTMDPTIRGSQLPSGAFSTSV